MAQFDESPTILWPAPSPPAFGAGCPICGKPPGIPLEGGARLITSADTFCSVEHRREWHLRDGCDRCGEVRPFSPDAPGWKIGGFTSYMDTEIICPRCIVEWPKYEEYVAEIKAANLELNQRIYDECKLQGELLPSGFTIEADGTVALSVNYDEGFYMTLEKLEATLKRVRDLDVAAYLRELAASDARIEELRSRGCEPKPYQRWLAGER